MKSFHSFYVLFLACAMASCAGRGNHTNQSVTTLAVVSGSQVEKAKSSELFSSVNIVSLETNQDVLLGDGIVKIDRRGDAIYSGRPESGV
jgi:hypothetical protein